MYSDYLTRLYCLLWKQRDNPISQVIYWHSETIHEEILNEALEHNT
jgi:hypothetical protein